MAITLEQGWTLMHEDGALWRKAEFAIVRQAGIIFAESAATTNHANRLIWATAARVNPLSKLNEMKNALLLDSAIANNGQASTDNQIIAALAAIVDQFATGS